MSDNQFLLESLPNEILIETFEYLDARDLFRAFYNLNSRFNELLQSLNEICLILSIRDRDEVIDDTIFLPYVNTLIVKYKTDVILNHYTTIRRLILICLPYTRPYKLETIILPHLEYLSIILKGSFSVFSIYRLHEPIFSNSFPCLKFCSLPITSTIQKTERWTKLLSLRILKVGHIGLFTYIGILSACPNLNFFYFLEEKVLQTLTVLPQYVNHENLKRLVIKEKYIGPISHVGILNEYLLCVPNLEHLSIHVTTYHMRNLQYLFEFDWLSSIISVHLPLLCQFNFHLPVFRARRINKIFDESTFSKLQQRFKTMHKKRYQSQLIINRKNLQPIQCYESTDSSSDSSD
ncbi:unnamed protein product [Rotaria sp. Silwood2]|nr:unnamed protein product [Rotaria sp. Silwood2]CAF2765707.1 unnamed protein product [Rotaria sp. Silwood2]CAF3017228.1 unnamed protein product [Rotaria sp. Silwood2]CAF3482769.1 unnamed protein product [Rotaria sp. Silwood2]CAF4536281.1 unnamed protein product [Rotaria sp. Silwood2]